MLTAFSKVLSVSWLTALLLGLPYPCTSRGTPLPSFRAKLDPAANLQNKINV